MSVVGPARQSESRFDSIILARSEAFCCTSGLGQANKRAFDRWGHPGGTSGGQGAVRKRAMVPSRLAQQAVCLSVCLSACHRSTGTDGAGGGSVDSGGKLAFAQPATVSLLHEGAAGQSRPVRPLHPGHPCASVTFSGLLRPPVPLAPTTHCGIAPDPDR